MSLGASIPGSSSSSSSSPDGTPADTEVAFAEAVQAAVRERLAREATPAALLETGEVDPVRLCRYASGRLEGAERADAERMVARSRWAVGRVAALVKAARASRPGSPPGLTLLAKLIVSANPNQLDPNRIAGAALLEEIGRDPAMASGPETAVLARLEAEQPRVRAAALLALGRADLARPIFGALSESGSPLLQLARKIAHAEDTDRAWAELLSSL